MIVCNGRGNIIDVKKIKNKKILAQFVNMTRKVFFLYSNFRIFY